MKALIIFLHVFSQTGQPLPSSSSKGKEREREKKGSEGPLGMHSPSPQRLKHPAEQPILHLRLQRPPTLWSPRLVWQQLAPPGPCEVPAVTLVAAGWTRVRLGSVCCFGKSEMPAASGRSGRFLSAHLHPFHRLRGPRLPWPHPSRCQDTTDWADAEDVPFLWFFCLF